jgi:hypothetical protein
MAPSPRPAREREAGGAAPGRVLPPYYAAAFAAPPIPGEGAPHVWAFRAWIGEWKRVPLLRPPGDAPHFNDAPPGEALAPLEAELAALEPAVAPLLAALAAERDLAEADRPALARLVALLAVRCAPHAPELSAREAASGAEAMEKALLDMGWVFWTAPAGVHFVSGSSPFHAAFPAAEASRTAAFDLADPSVELTCPLGPAVALHATWRRRGTLWRRAREEVLLEVNGRTCASSRAFLVAPVPQLPG